MSDPEKQVLRALDTYKSAVLTKNAETFMHLYDPEVRVFVCVWPWHLELSRTPAEHRVDGEHGGRGVHGGDGVCRSMPARGRQDRGHAQAGAGLLDASHQRDPVSVSQQAASCEAAALRFGCSMTSVAW